MPNVTVLGANGLGGNAVWSIPYTAQSNYALAQDLANQITAGVTDGKLQNELFTGMVPPLTGGVPGVLDIGGPAPVDVGPVTINWQNGYVGLVDNSTGAVTVHGPGTLTSQPITVLAGQGGLTFRTSHMLGTEVGTGYIVAGGGTNNVQIGNMDAGAAGGYVIDLGSGSDTITAHGGANTINGGVGSNMMHIGGASDNLISLTGSDTLVAHYGSGADTINVSAGDSHGQTIKFFQGWSGTAVINASAESVGGATDSVLGGGGSVTLYGGAHQDIVFGGTAGHNYIVAGSDVTSSITGGGQGDQLFAGMNGGGVISAGSGNETLMGSMSAASVAGTLFNASAATGGANIHAGLGADTINAGVGQESFWGNSTGKGDFFEFNYSVTGASKSMTGGPTNVAINDFTVGKDTVALNGYGFTSAQQVASEVTVSGSNSFLTLNDGTKIEFTHVTNLNASNFKV